MRKAIEDAAIDLLADGTCTREVSQVLARRFGCQQATVDAVLVALIAENRAAAATFDFGLASTREAAMAARRGVWEDCA